MHSPNIATYPHSERIAKSQGYRTDYSESIDVYKKLAKRKLEGKCIGCGNEPCSCKTKGKLRNRKNFGKSEWREPRVDANVETIKKQLYPKKKVGESIEESAPKSVTDTIRKHIEQLNIIMEVAPPDQESWVKKNKLKFKKEYGEEKGTEICYKTRKNEQLFPGNACLK